VTFLGILHPRSTRLNLADLSDAPASRCTTRQGFSWLFVAGAARPNGRESTVDKNVPVPTASSYRAILR
jgi:hypothetical protein